MTDEPRGENAPTREDERHDDHEYNPALEPKSSKAWLNLLRESEKAFERWNDHCDNLDKRFANLERLAEQARDREFQLFWANLEVLKPSIYAKAPVPVVVPKFKDQRPLQLAASEMMERCCVVAFDMARINDLMLLVRDDTVLYSRGVAWCRYEKGEKDSYYDYEKVCIDHKNRRDFLHSLSRSWREVTWVAAASYLTRSQARKRFHEHSGDCYQEADYKVDRDAEEIGGTDKRERAKFWEIWDKNEQARGVGRGGLRGHPRRGRSAPAARGLLSLPQAGLCDGAAGLADPGARGAAVQGPARRGERAHRAHSRAVRGAAGEGLLSGGRRRVGRGDRDRDQDELARRDHGADQQLGGVRRLEGDHHLDADRHDCRDRHAAGDDPQAGD